MKTKTYPVILVTLLALFLTSAPDAFAKSKGGGKVTESEPSEPLLPNIADKVMRIYDRNKDGMLTADEIKRLASADPASAKAAKPYDYDGNNILDRNEIADWRNEVAKTNQISQDDPSSKKTKK